MCICSRQRPEIGNNASQTPVLLPSTPELKQTKKHTELGEQVWKAAERSKIPTSKEEMKNRFEEAQKALGVIPNPALIERIHSQRQVEKESSIRKGDTIFSLKDFQKGPKASGSKKSKSGDKEDIKKRKKEGNTDEDTLYPRAQHAKKADEKDDVVDEVMEEPNSENYMYNEQEIFFVCHDMIRQLTKDDINDAGELSFMKSSESAIQWDPFAPIEELEKRECFNCQTLRRNTFLANALSMPTANERKTAISKPKLPNKVTFNERAIDITEWEEFACTAEENSQRTQSDTDMEIMKTQEAHFSTPITAYEAKSKSIKGMQELKLILRSAKEPVKHSIKRQSTDPTETPKTLAESKHTQRSACRSVVDSKATTARENKVKSLKG